VKYLSYLLVIAGVCILIYGGYDLFQGNFNQNERLKEAKNFVLEDIIKKADNPEDLSESGIYDFQTGETVGTLYIPKLDREIAIVEGTDEEELAQGVGHYTDTGYPGENKQILLSGHRDTVFRDFGELEDGDEFHVKMENGTFVYRMDDHTIVDAEDRTIIDPNRKDEFLTVSTCYPFSYVGSAPDRYVIYAYPK